MILTVQIEMRERPIGQLMEFFQSGGVDVNYMRKQGYFPFRTKTEEFKPNDWTVDASKSSQMLTALMMIAPLYGESKTIFSPNGTVSKPFLNITSEMIKEFSGDDDYSCEIEEDKIQIRAQYKRTTDFVYDVEPDATAASYFLNAYHKWLEDFVKYMEFGMICYREIVHILTS